MSWGGGCSVCRAPCGRSTTLLYCGVNAVAFHSLSLVTVLHTDDDVAMVMHDDVSDDVMHVMDDAMMSDGVMHVMDGVMVSSM